MTELAAATDDVGPRIDALQDLFRRRLLEDRDKKAVIDRLFERVERAESAVAGDHLRPVADRFALLLARFEADREPDTQFVKSLADELRDALEACFGLVEVSYEEFNPELHDVDHVIGDGVEVSIDKVLRPGFRWADRVLRPALVVIRRDEPQEPA